MLPLSGSEPVLDVQKWNTMKAIITHNCYAFALNDYFRTSKKVPKQQPGDRSGLSTDHADLSTCEIADRVLADNPGNIYRELAERACRDGFYKIFLFTDPRPDTADYHWYRQVKDMKYKLGPKETLTQVMQRFQVPKTKVHRIGKRKYMLSDVNVWSHKAGHATGALLQDSCGRVIRDPRLACRSSGNMDYTKMCGSFCARAGHVRSRKNQNYQ